MTLIVLIILAAVSLSAVFSDKGVFERAENAGEKIETLINLFMGNSKKIFNSKSNSLSKRNYIK